MYTLDTPSFFHLLWSLPFFVVLFFWHKRRKKRFRKKYFSDQNISLLVEKEAVFKGLYKQILFILIFVLAVIAMVNPKVGIKTKKIVRKGCDVVFLLDISRSMDATDVAPSRLEKAKNIIYKMIEKLKTDRVGLVVYAGGSYPMVPMTDDYNLMKQFVASAQSDLMSSKGTAISLALRSAARFLNQDTLSAKARVLVVLSDGEDHMGINFEEVGALLPSTKIITVAVGTESGSPIPYQNDYKKDTQGNVVISKLNPENLKQLAQATGGLFIYTQNSQEIGAYFENFLFTLEKKQMEVASMADFEYQYTPILLLALLFLFIDIFLLNRKNYWQKWHEG